MSILCYHTVDSHFRSRLSLTPDQFEAHCRFLAADRDVVDLETAVQLMDERGRLPSGTVALTFDDGLDGVYRHVYPTLVRYNLPATVFMVAHTLTGSHPNVDWIDGTPPGVLGLITMEQMLEMASDGIRFGSHSSRHLDLTSLSHEECLEDLTAARRILEDALGRGVSHLAYPRGRHNEMVREAAAHAGHKHAFALPEGPEPIGPWSVPRVGVYAHNSLPAVRLKSTRPYLVMRMSRTYPVARSVVRSMRSIRGKSR